MLLSVFFSFPPLSHSLPLLSSVSLPCMPQMFFLVAPTDRNLLARRKARSSPGERSTKPPVCIQQMQKAGPSATSSLCHMGLRDLIQEGTFFSFITSAYISLCHIHRIQYKHTSESGRCNSKIKFILLHMQAYNTGRHSMRLRRVQELFMF